ncbi:MAG: molybdopterin-dependent oxidoreductase [Oscillospiraceae bacterium]|nr:molybdopterin-dependent oxidoreductase [Oscillospiraceae bacterium]
MDRKVTDVKNGWRTFKTASLMGPHSGPPCSVESDKELGKITRIRPYNYNENQPVTELNPWKIEGRGIAFKPPEVSKISPMYLAYKTRVYSKNRVKYPLKRVDWDPNGERHPENRGKSKYVRISWDEATDIVASELKRLIDKYGPETVLIEADMHGEGKHLAPSHGCPNRLMSLLGGYTVQMRNIDSWEGWSWGARNIHGCEPVGEMMPNANLYQDIIDNADACAYWSADAASTAMGFDGLMAMRLAYYMSDVGLKAIYVDPALNFTAATQADKWIPVLPNTDAALQLGMIYVWLTEDLYNKNYVATHCYGYQEFFDYVLGKEDGIPKTPAWASERCGVPEWTIKAFARYWGKHTVSTIIGNGGPQIRGPYCHEPARLQIVMLAMQGLGGPGVHQAKILEFNLFTNQYPLPYQGKSVPEIPHFAEILRPPHSDAHRYSLLPFQSAIPKVKEICETLPNPPLQSIPRCLVHNAILNGHVEWWGLQSFCGPKEEQWEHHEYPAPGCSKIHMLWSDSPCNVTCWNDGYSFAKALHTDEIEFFLVQHPWLENDSTMADLILPVATLFELNDIGDDSGSAIYQSVYRQRKSCAPVGESVSDFEVVARIAKKIDEKIYMKYTGNEASDDELIELFWQASNVSHLDEKDDFHKKDIFVIPTICEDNVTVKPGMREFYEDPVNHPLKTPTGLLEITSTKIAEHFPDDDERPPYPKWIENGTTHSEGLNSPRAKDYPLLCMSNHGHYRFHAECDDIIWNREFDAMKIRGKDGYQYEAAWLNPKTAAERGIVHGDIVKVFNERGTVLCGAYLTEKLIPGVVYVDHGARFDPIDPECLDRGGAINLITPNNLSSKHATGMVVSGFLTEVAKVTDEEMAEWKQKYPEAFARPIDNACGVCLDTWLIKEEQ